MLREQPQVLRQRSCRRQPGAGPASARRSRSGSARVIWAWHGLAVQVDEQPWLRGSDRFWIFSWSTPFTVPERLAIHQCRAGAAGAFVIAPAASSPARSSITYAAVWAIKAGRSIAPDLPVGRRRTARQGGRGAGRQRHGRAGPGAPLLHRADDGGRVYFSSPATGHCSGVVPTCSAPSTVSGSTSP